MEEIFQASAQQKEKFRTAANRLLNSCFLLKKKEDTRKDYIFVKENRDQFLLFFDLLGYDLLINEDQGVIGLSNRSGTGRLELKKYESILLLILRLLYLEKRKEISAFSEEVTVLMEEIREKYALLKIKNKPYMDKSMEQRMVSLFRRYNILQNLDSDITKADARIVIYPSVIMAVTVENINAYHDMTKRKLEEYTADRKGEDDGWDDEASDQGTADQLALL
ncbi:MAG: DUF4194 domain-containing protein [Lachnospiraceae bacterium]|nr:DUF4194 domain-containing protein [Lachnospiraceae bacterium]